jgi:hypothetical protein
MNNFQILALKSILKVYQFTVKYEKQIKPECIQFEKVIIQN